MGKFDFGGAAGGAASGAAAGSTFGPIGTGVGAVVGGITGGLFGGRKKKKVSTMDKYQKQIYKDYVSSLQGGGPYSDQFQFDADKARNMYNEVYGEPQMQKFQEEMVPAITGSFRGKNLQNSSYVGNALAKAGRDVQSNINRDISKMIYKGQEKATDRRQQALDKILSMSTFAYQKPQASPFDAVLQGLAEHSGKYIANKFMPIS